LSNAIYKNSMILVKLIIVLFFISISTSAYAQTDEMIPVTLNEVGSVKTIPFRLDRPLSLQVRTYFATAELGNINLVVRDSNDKIIDWQRAAALPAGDYQLAVSAGGTSPITFYLKITLTEPLDEFNFNISRETAAEVDVPWRRHLQVRDQNSPGWFRLNVSQPGILAINVNPPQAKLFYSVEDEKGALLYKIAEEYDNAGTRYMRVEGGNYFLILWGENGGNVEVEVSLFAPNPLVDEGSGWVAIGVAENSSDMQQLKLISEASGKPLKKAYSADEIRSEMEQATKALESGRRSKIWLILLVVSAALAMFVYLRRRRKSYI
jgi:hypothetical protein